MYVSRGVLGSVAAAAVLAATGRSVSWWAVWLVLTVAAVAVAVRRAT